MYSSFSVFMSVAFFPNRQETKSSATTQSIVCSSSSIRGWGFWLACVEFALCEYCHPKAWSSLTRDSKRIAFNKQSAEHSDVFLKSRGEEPFSFGGSLGNFRFNHNWHLLLLFCIFPVHIVSVSVVGYDHVLNCKLLWLKSVCQMQCFLMSSLIFHDNVLD